MLPTTLVGKFFCFSSFILLLLATFFGPLFASANEMVQVGLSSGTSNTGISIEVPPGRQGVQPQLGLSYSSASSNGWVGRGWNLETSSIERQTKFGLDYTADDYRASLSGINGDLVNVGPNEFRAKIESSFTKVIKLTAPDGKPYFEAINRTGTKEPGQNFFLARLLRHG